MVTQNTAHFNINKNDVFWWNYCNNFVQTANGRFSTIAKSVFEESANKWHTGKYKLYRKYVICLITILIISVRVLYYLRVLIRHIMYNSRYFKSSFGWLNHEIRQKIPV